LVMPAMIKPLREEWETVKISVEILFQKNKVDKALEALNAFHFHLCEIKVLDPACGSANFLYVALEHLKRLEGEVLNAIRDLSAGQTMLDTGGLMVDPHQFLGIEINPRAAAIAEIVLWIGFLQWHYRINGKLELSEPILRDFKNIENRDAVLEYDSVETALDENGQPITQWDGVSKKVHPATGKEIPDESSTIEVKRYINPKISSWPKSDYIVGNPPFIGNKRMQYHLGDGYVQALRKTYNDEVPNTSDYVMYWWQKAATLVGNKAAKQFGFITTNSITQVFNRSVIDNNLSPKGNLALSFAIPDHPWVDSNDGAAVRIAMTAAKITNKNGVLKKVITETDSGTEEIAVELLSKEGKINSDLSIGANLSEAKTLKANEIISGQGVIVLGSGFLLSGEELSSFINKEPQAEKFIKGYKNGKDIVSKSRGLKIIDLHGLSEEDLKNYPITYQRIYDLVRPKRLQMKDKARREKWWLFGRSNQVIRDAIDGLPQYIATCRTAKHRSFTMLDGSVLPDAKIVAIGLGDYFHLGCLSSRLHIRWAMAAGGWLGVGCWE